MPGVRLVSQHAHDIHHRVIPCLALGIPGTADFAVLAGKPDRKVLDALAVGSISPARRLRDGGYFRSSSRF